MIAIARARASRAILCSIVLAYVGFAAMWATRVPPFAPPDEMAHADYMFAFFDAGRFYRVDSNASANDVLPETRYLERISGYRRIRYNALGRVPRGYGTPAFYAAARGASPPVSNAPRPAGSAMPYVMSVYPSTYYLVVAAIARAAFDGTHSIVGAFFAARAFNVALGAGTLLLAFSALRKSGLGATASLLGVGSIAMLPLFCWVSAYVQPDNLVVFLVTAVLWAASRKRHGIASSAAAVCALCLVKPLYGSVVWLPTLWYAASIVRGRAPVARVLVVLGIFPIVALIAAGHLTPVSGGLADMTDTANAVHADGLTHLRTLAGPLRSVLADVYLGGAVFENYWLAYGVHETPYLATRASSPLVVIYVTLTVVALVAWMLVSARRLARIVRVGAGRSVALAFRLCGRGLPVNVYVAYTAFLIAASLFGNAPLSLVGRYWLPLVLPLTLVILTQLPKLLRRPMRRRASNALAATLVLMTVPINLCTPRAVERDFYAAPHEQARFDFGGLVVDGGGDKRSFLASTDRVRLRDRITVRGFALDVATGLPAERILVVSDGRVVARARPTVWKTEPAEEWHDDVLDRAAFVAVIPATRFGAGRHDVSIVVWRSGSVPLPLKHHVTLVVS